MYELKCWVIKWVINLRFYDKIVILGHQHAKNILRFSEKIIFMCQREGESYLKVHLVT